MNFPGNMRTELLKPAKERAWGWPAVANFTLGGAGAGWYILESVRLFFSSGPASAVLSGPTGLATAVMVGLGFLAVSFESGRPWRGMYLLGNLRGSWMSIEILSGAIFIAAAALDHFFSSPALKVAAACAALELVISHGFILYRARAMSAWNVPLIPLLFLSSALAAGGGLLLIMGALLHVIDGSGLIIVLTCLITDMIVWAVYVAGSRDIQFRKATDILRRSPFLVLVMGLGHLLPLSMLAALMLITDVSDGTGIRGNIVLLSGLCIIAGGVIQKIGIIKGVDYLRPILLGREKHGKAI